MKKIRTILVESDESVLEDCIRHLSLEPDIHLIGQYTDILGAIRLTTCLHTDVLVLGGISMDSDGIDLLRQITELYPFTKVLLLVTDSANQNLLPALSAGVLGFLDTASLENALAKAVRSVHQGEAWLPRSLVGTLLKQFEIRTAGTSVNYINLH